MTSNNLPSPVLQSSILNSLNLCDPNLIQLSKNLPPVPELHHSFDRYTFETDIADPVHLLQELDKFFKSCYDIDSVISPSSLSVKYGQTDTFHSVYDDIFVNFAFQEHDELIQSNIDAFQPFQFTSKTAPTSNTNTPASPLQNDTPFGAPNSSHTVANNITDITPHKSFPHPRFQPVVIPITFYDAFPKNSHPIESQPDSYPQQFLPQTAFSLSPQIAPFSQHPHHPLDINNLHPHQSIQSTLAPLLNPVSDPHISLPTRNLQQTPLVTQHSESSTPRGSKFFEHGSIDKQRQSMVSDRSSSIIHLRNQDERDSLQYTLTLRTTQASMDQTNPLSHESDFMYRMSMMTGTTDGDGAARTSEQLNRTSIAESSNNIQRSSIDFTTILQQHQAINRAIRDGGAVLKNKNSLTPSIQRGQQRRGSLLFSPGTHTNAPSDYNNFKRGSSMLPPVVDNLAIQDFAESFLTDTSPSTDTPRRAKHHIARRGSTAVPSSNTHSANYTYQNKNLLQSDSPPSKLEDTSLFHIPSISPRSARDLQKDLLQDVANKNNTMTNVINSDMGDARDNLVTLNPPISTNLLPSDAQHIRNSLANPDRESNQNNTRRSHQSNSILTALGQISMTFEWAFNVIIDCLDDVELCFPNYSIQLPNYQDAATNLPIPTITSFTDKDLPTMGSTYQNSRKFLSPHIIPMLIQAFDALSSQFLEQIHMDVPTAIREFAQKHNLPYDTLTQLSIEQEQQYEPRPALLQKLLLKINKSLNFLVLNQNLQLRISLLQFYGKVVQTRIGLSQLHSVLLNPFWFLKALINIHSPQEFVYMPSEPISTITSPRLTDTNSNTNTNIPSSLKLSSPTKSLHSPPTIIGSSPISLSSAHTAPQTTFDMISTAFETSVFLLIRDEVISTTQMLRVDPILPGANLLHNNLYFHNTLLPANAAIASNVLPSLDSVPIINSILHPFDDSITTAQPSQIITTSRPLSTSSSLNESENENEIKPDNFFNAFSINIDNEDIPTNPTIDQELVLLGEISILERREIVRLLIEIYYRILPWYRNHLIQLHQMILLKRIQHNNGSKLRQKTTPSINNGLSQKRSSHNVSLFDANDRDNNTSVSSTLSLSSAATATMVITMATVPSMHPGLNNLPSLTLHSEHDEFSTNTRTSTTTTTTKDDIRFENPSEDEGVILKPLHAFNLPTPTNSQKLPQTPSGTDAKQTKGSLVSRLFSRNDKPSKTPTQAQTPTSQSSQTHDPFFASSLERDNTRSSTDSSMTSQPSTLLTRAPSSSIFSRIFSLKKDDTKLELASPTALDTTPTPSSTLINTLASIPANKSTSAIRNELTSEDDGDDHLRLAQQMDYEEDGVQDQEDGFPQHHSPPQLSQHHFDEDSCSSVVSSNHRNSSSKLTNHQRISNKSHDIPSNANDERVPQVHDAHHLYAISNVFSSQRQHLVESGRDSDTSSLLRRSTPDSLSFMNPDNPTASTTHSSSSSTRELSFSGLLGNNLNAHHNMAHTVIKHHHLDCYSSTTNGITTVHYRSPLIDTVMLMYAQSFAIQNKSKELKILQSHLGHLEDIFELLLHKFKSFTGNSRFVSNEINTMMTHEQRAPQQQQTNTASTCDFEQVIPSIPTLESLGSDSTENTSASGSTSPTNQQFSKRYLAFLQNDFAL